MRSVAPILPLCAVSLFTGCALQTVPPSTTLEPAAIAGHVHGGNSPVAGARIYVFEAATTGYGQPAVGDISSAYGTADPVYGANYITSDGNGDFLLTGKYSCTPGAQVYVLATQGNPGLGVGKSNPALAEMAAVGPCLSAGSLSTSLNIWISEATTVAAAYSLAGYMTAPNAVSRPATALATTGLANSFATVNSLVNVSSGQATTAVASYISPYTSPIATNTTPPTATLNTLANILTSCINSDGTGAGCSTLFANATSNGTSTGTVPTDTVTAALNIAHNQTANVANLYALATANPPFQPALSAQPTDWSLAMAYTPYAGGPPGAPIVYPYGPMAIDASGDVIIGMVNGSNTGPFSATLNNLGAGVTSSVSVSSDARLSAYAIDSLGNAWGPGFSSSEVMSKYVPATGKETHYTATFTNPSAIAVDPSNNLYVSDISSSGIFTFNSVGTQTGIQEATTPWVSVAVDSSTNLYTLATGTASLFINGTAYSGGGLTTHPVAQAFDSSGNVWVVSGTQDAGPGNGPVTLSKFNISSSVGGSPTATAVSGSGYPGTGLGQGYLRSNLGITLDGASNVWVASAGGISEFSNSGAYLKSVPVTNYTGFAIDGSGNLWAGIYNSNTYTPTIYEYIGAAIPVATPTLPGQFGVRP